MTTEFGPEERQAARARLDAIEPGGTKLLGFHAVFRRALDALDAQDTQLAEIEDDLHYVMLVRKHALEIAASHVQPGPDGQDYIDRERMITEWVNEAHDEAQLRPRPLRPDIDATEAELDLLKIKNRALAGRLDAIRAAVSGDAYTTGPVNAITEAHTEGYNRALSDVRRVLDEGETR